MNKSDKKYHEIDLFDLDVESATALIDNWKKANSRSEASLSKELHLSRNWINDLQAKNRKGITAKRIHADIAIDLARILNVSINDLQLFSLDPKKAIPIIDQWEIADKTRSDEDLSKSVGEERDWVRSLREAQERGVKAVSIHRSSAQNLARILNISLSDFQRFELDLKKALSFIDKWESEDKSRSDEGLSESVGEGCRWIHSLRESQERGKRILNISADTAMALAKSLDVSAYQFRWANVYEPIQIDDKAAAARDLLDRLLENDTDCNHEKILDLLIVATCKDNAGCARLLLEKWLHDEQNHSSIHDMLLKLTNEPTTIERGVKIDNKEEEEKEPKPSLDELKTIMSDYMHETAEKMRDYLAGVPQSRSKTANADSTKEVSEKNIACMYAKAYWWVHDFFSHLYDDLLWSGVDTVAQMRSSFKSVKKNLQKEERIEWAENTIIREIGKLKGTDKTANLMTKAATKTANTLVLYFQRDPETVQKVRAFIESCAE